MPPKGKNPHNPQSDLFKALTRLFSGPIINYRSQSGRRIRRQHLDKFSSRFKTSSGQQFKKTLYKLVICEVSQDSIGPYVETTVARASPPVFQSATA